MSENDLTQWAAARDHLFESDTVDSAYLTALETVVQHAIDAGAVTIKTRVVSRADRRGDKTTKFATDVRYARAVYDLTPWMFTLLIGRIRELEAITPTRTGGERDAE